MGQTKHGLINGDDEFYLIIPTMQSLINILQTPEFMHKYSVLDSSVPKKRVIHSENLYFTNFINPN